MIRVKFFKKIISVLTILTAVVQLGSAMPVEASTDMQISGDIEVIFNLADADMKKYIDAFEAKYPRVNVKYTCYPNFEEQIVPRFESGDYGDVLYVPAYMETSDLSTYYAYLGDENILSQKYNYLDGGRKIGSAVYGIPTAAYMSGILYNKDVFYQAGVTEIPKTPDEFLQALRDIDSRTEAIPFYTNFADPWALTLWDTFSYIEMTGSADYKYTYFTYEKDAFLEGSTHYQVYKLLYDIVKNGLCETDPKRSDWEKSKKMLNNGELASMVIGSWALYQFQAAGENADAIAFMPFPNEISGRQYITVSTDYAMGISKNSKYPEAARAFLDFMLDESGCALDQETLSIVKTDPYPDAYGEMENVILITNSIATATEYSDYLKMCSKLNFEDGKEAQRIILSALGESDESFDDIMKDWNRRWESSRTSKMKVQERNLNLGTGTSIIQNYEINFSQTEHEYIKEKKTLKVGYLTDFAPFQYEDEEGFTGVTRDLCEIIAENTGLELEYIPFANSSAVAAALFVGEIDMAAGMDKGVGYDQSLRYSKDYMTYMNLLVKNETVDMNLGVGSKLACVKGENNSFSETSGIITRKYNTYADAIKAVENLEADYVVVNYYSADYYIKAQECSHVTMLPVSENAGMYFAFNENVDTRLISICNKCIYGVPEENLQVMLREHLEPPTQEITLMRFVEANPVACIIAVVLIFLFIATVAFAFFNEKMKSARKHEMDMKRYEILSSLVKEYIFEYDFNSDVIRFDQKSVDKFGFDKEVKAHDNENMGPGVLSICMHIAEVEDAEIAESTAFLLTDKDGRTQWYKVLMHKVKDADGKSQHVIAKLVNVQKEMEEKQRMAEKAEKDPLTGIYNRDGLRARLATIYENLEGQMPIALIMIDFDDFKSVNDKLGHAGGDVALKMLAGTMNDLFGDNAVNCRYGGDEFMIVTHGIPVDELERLIAELVSKMDYNLSYQNATQRLSVSAGAYYSYTNVSYEELFAEADSILYQVKESGKNNYKIMGRKE